MIPYRDETIQLDFKIPTSLRNTISEVEQYCDDGDEVMSRLRLEDVDSLSKIFLENGKITREQFTMIWKRYGWK